VTLGICIVEAAANLGLGTRLMRLMETEARAMGARKMTLAVWEANKRAVHVYEKLGYRVTKIVQRDDAQGEDPTSARRVPDGASTNLLEMWLTLSGGADHANAVSTSASTATTVQSSGTTTDAPLLPSPRQPPTVVLTPAQYCSIHHSAAGSPPRAPRPRSVAPWRPGPCWLADQGDHAGAWPRRSDGRAPARLRGRGGPRRRRRPV
jgi:hypothetical protein